MLSVWLHVSAALACTCTFCNILCTNRRDDTLQPGERVTIQTTNNDEGASKRVNTSEHERVSERTRTTRMTSRRGRERGAVVLVEKVGAGVAGEQGKRRGTKEERRVKRKREKSHHRTYQVANSCCSRRIPTKYLSIRIKKHWDEKPRRQTNVMWLSLGMTRDRNRGVTL